MTLKHKVPDYIIKPYTILESNLPVVLDSSPTGYGDGQYNRRMRREKERQNKKNRGRK